MPPSKTKKSIPPGQQLSLLDMSDTLRTAPCVPLIRQEVAQWRANDFPGITKTTRRLLAWWFKNDHRTLQGTQHAPIHIVKAIAGHAANQVTFVYLHVSAEEQRAAFVAVEAAYANAA